MRNAIAFAALLACAPTAAADYILGAQGYYWRAGVPYHRTIGQQYYAAGVYNGSYCHAGYYQVYQYTAVPNYTPPAAYVPPAAPVSYKDDNWRSKLLEAAIVREKVNGELLKQAQDQQYFEKSVQMLGLQGSLRSTTYSGYGSLNLGAFGANANTIYGQTQGYQQSQSVEVTGQDNLNVLLQQIGRSTDNIARLHGQAIDGATGIAKEMSAGQIRALEIRARAEAAATFLRSLEQPSFKAESKKIEFGPAPPQPQVLPKLEAPKESPDDARLKQLWTASATESCLSCHGGKDKDGKVIEKGKFSVFRDVPNMEPDDLKELYRRLDSSTPTITLPNNAGTVSRMPKDAPPLSDDAKSVWLFHFTKLIKDKAAK